ncbi:MAG TPA: dTDP-4-dehydrorhamnose 3,5-epimerase [Thermoanaerobaculia bacterium]|nr:dTDP-4-dehydrorhamnose 3,5-epimerase [Thermoanaerobaculia bacterium]
MIFRVTPLAGAWVLELERREDDRGFFARTFCRRELAEHGLDPEVAQCSVSFSRRRGTLRGLHFQRAPHQEAKLVRCTRGSIFDAIVDLRPRSETFARPFTVVLDAEERNQLYVPPGFAHGFLTLADDVEVSYQMSTPWAPGHEGGYRWDDPAFAIPWPEPVRVISERDRALPTLAEQPIEEPAR